MPRDDLRIKVLRQEIEDQYKDVIADLKKTIIWWQTNAWKATFVSLYFRIKRIWKF